VALRHTLLEWDSHGGVAPPRGEKKLSNTKSDPSTHFNLKNNGGLYPLPSKIAGNILTTLGVIEAYRQLMNTWNELPTAYQAKVFNDSSSALDRWIRGAAEAQATPTMAFDTAPSASIAPAALDLLLAEPTLAGPETGDAGKMLPAAKGYLAPHDDGDDLEDGEEGEDTEVDDYLDGAEYDGDALYDEAETMSGDASGAEEREGNPSQLDRQIMGQLS
jgi:hypothetical protein